MSVALLPAGGIRIILVDANVLYSRRTTPDDPLAGLVTTHPHGMRRVHETTVKTTTTAPDESTVAGVTHP